MAQLTPMPRRSPKATYFGSGRARAIRSATVISNVYRAARAAPLQENKYVGFKVGGIVRSPVGSLLQRDWCWHARCAV